jgi:hypothetical protein
MRRMFLGLGLMALMVGCASTKEFAPVQAQPVGLRVPNQQRLVAKSATEAVKQACTQLNLRQYAGKTVRVEINGVFPHSAEDLLDYLATAVEAEAASAGLTVLPRPDARFTPQVAVYSAPPAGHAEQPLPPPPPPAAAPPDAHKGARKSEPSQPAAAPAEAAPVPEAPLAAPVLPPHQMPPERQPADLRLAVSVDWGGVDMRDEKYLKPWPFGGQVALGGVGLVATGAGLGSDTPPVWILGMVGMAGAAIWAIAHSSEGHTFTLVGRVQLTMRTIPRKAGEPVGQGTGSGESSIVVDPRDQYGYQPIMTLPKP